MGCSAHAIRLVISFPNSVWERRRRKLCFAFAGELPGDAKRSFAREVSKQSLGTR